MFIYRKLSAIANLATFMPLFEQYLLDVGWKIESGAGTSDIIISSKGEFNDADKLFARFWVTGGNILNYRVQDDIIGTHTTTTHSIAKNAGNIDAYLSGDKDMFVIKAQPNATWALTAVVGMVMPFNLVLPDSTYRTISASGVGSTATTYVLRNYDGTWNVSVSQPTAGFPSIRDRFGGLNRIVVGGNLIFHSASSHQIGECKHITAVINAGQMAIGDTFTTTAPGGTDATTWLVTDKNFGIRTGGEYPIGKDYEVDPSVLYPAWITSRTDFFDAVWSLLQPLGWTRTDNSGVHNPDWIYHSVGENGLENINIRLYWDSAANDIIYIGIRDAIGAHELLAGFHQVEYIDFPGKMGFVANKDCLIFWKESVESGDDFSWQNVAWVGRVKSLNPDLQVGNTDYCMAIFTNVGGTTEQRAWLLRKRDGTWGVTYTTNNATGQSGIKTPQLDTTLAITPMQVNDGSAGEAYGFLTYLFRYKQDASPSGINCGDEMFYGKKLYKTFRYWNTQLVPYAVRIK